MADEKRPAHHDFEAFILWLRKQRGKRIFGETRIVWRDGEVVKLESGRGFQPGEHLE